MDVLIIGGFLGSGKTSTLLALARHAIADGKTVAIIENEFGKVGIDDGLIQHAGLNVRSLFSGCVCCTLAGDLCECVSAVEREIQPDLLMIESTGIGFPESIRVALLEYVHMPSRTLVVVDAQRWMKMIRAMEHIVVRQLENTDCVLINKADTVDQDHLEAIESDIRSRCPEAYSASASAREGLDGSICEVILHG